MRAESPDTGLASPAKLDQRALGSDVGRTSDANGLRQVLSPQAAVDVQVVDDFKYEMRFYEKGKVTETAGNGLLFEPVTGAQPWVVWRVENPDASTNTYNRLRITKLTESVSNEFNYVWDEQTEEWSLDSANGLLKESFKAAWDAEEEYRTDTHVLMNAADQVVLKTETTYRSYAWGTEQILFVEDPDGDALTTAKTFYDQHTYMTGLVWNPYADRYTRLASVVNPDGSWERTDYDEVGRKSVVLRPWKNAASNASVDEVEALYYHYEVLDPNEIASIRDKQPRTVEKKVQGITVEKTFHAYYNDMSGDIVKIEEKSARADASYGDADNLRTITVLHGSGFFAGETKTIQFPDGRFDSYTYEQGDYLGGETTPGDFVPGTGNFERITIVHGTTNSPNGVAFKTTKEIKIRNGLHHEHLNETYVCTGAGDERVDWTVQAFDGLGHLVGTFFANGTSKSSSWGTGCCGKESDVDVDGTTTLYTYDALGRKTTQVKEGVSAGEYPFQPDVTTTYSYDADGRILTEIVTAGGLTLVTSNEYDMAGRLVKTVDPAGLVTTYAYEEGGRIKTITHPGGTTEITENYLDGRIKSITGSGTVPRYYEYGVDSNGFQWTLVYMGPEGTNSPMWEKTTTDLLGRIVKTDKPGFGGTQTVEYTYNTKGQLTKVESTGQADTLYEYDELGNRTRSGLDMNENGVLDLASADRIQETDSRYVESGSNWWQEAEQRVYAAVNDDDPTTVSIQRKAFGSGCACQAQEAMAIDIHGNQTIATTAIDRDAKKVTRTTVYPDSTNAAVDVSVNGLLVSSKSKTGITTTFSYDALGRRVGVTDPRTGTAVMHYNEKGQIDFVEDAASNRTSYTYDSDTGRRIAVTDALTNTTYTAYDIQGRVTNTWGATYPVSYTYDDLGRMIEMRTWRDEAGQPDVTSWHYDEAIGLLTNKSYADSSSVSYSYDLAGRLARRTWARGVTTDYDYDAMGQLDTIDYSDSTPDVVFTYDRVGRQLTITDVLGTRTNTYDPSTLVLTEEQLPDGTTLARAYDSLGRSSGLSLGSDYSLIYGYDDLGRFSSISSSVSSASSVVNYSYLPNSDLIGQISNFQFQVSRIYEPDRNLIASIQNRFSGSLVSQFDYENDAVGRRTLRVDTLSTTNVFGYNLRSELTEATMGTNVFGYIYDPIGNRRWATNNAEVTEYLANELNQYTNITGLGAPAYDADGNMVSCGGWTFVWDAENRLIVASNEAIVVNNTYDYMSRRIEKAVGLATNRFVYDGWNVIRELVTDNGSLVTNSYVWGLDLSGTLQGAGGIGSLLSVVRDPSSAAYFAASDANGNVTDLVDPNGSVVAHYEYDPYGNEISRQGAEAQSNPYRFSTKYTDDETGLVYYGFRFYSSGLGRWLSGDPIEEMGFVTSLESMEANDHSLTITHDEFSEIASIIGAVDHQTRPLFELEDVTSLNLYVFVRNHPLLLIDSLGLCPQYNGGCARSSKGRTNSRPRNKCMSPLFGCTPADGNSGMVGRVLCKYECKFVWGGYYLYWGAYTYTGETVIGRPGGGPGVCCDCQP